MRLLIVGTNAPGALELYYFKYLEKLGVDVDLFDAQGRFLRYYEKNLINKLLFRSGVSNICVQINKELLCVASGFNPEVVLVFKGMEVLPRTLKILKQKGMYLVNYNPDNPFLFTGRGSGNKNVVNSLSLFDLHLTYNLEVLTEFVNRGITAKWLPFGYDVSFDLYNELKSLEEYKKACFIGTADKQRADFFNDLAKQGVSIDIYGTRWEKYKMHKNIKLYPAVYNKEFWKKMRQYRVQVNVLRQHNIHSHGMRSFEIAGVGGIQLANSTPEHKTFFEAGKEIFLFENVEDCARIINHLLSLPYEEVQIIRQRSRKRSELSNYSYYHRAGQFYNILKEISGN